MRQWVCCHVCGCTGYHREAETNRPYACPNGCEGGRIYEDAHHDWFELLASHGAEVHEDREPSSPAVQPTLPG